LGFDATGDVAYVSANGADAVFRVVRDPASGGVTAVGSGALHFIDLAPKALDATPELKGRAPIGVAVAHKSGFAFVANDVSWNVTAIDLGDAKQEVAGLSANPSKPRVAQSADVP